VLALLILIPLAGLVLLNLPLWSTRRTIFGFILLVTLAQAALAVFHPAGFFLPGGSLDGFFRFGLAEHGETTRVLLLSIAVVVFATAFVARRLLPAERARYNFLNVLVIALIGMNGTVLLSDLFSLYVFVEVTSIASFVLIAFNRDKNALEGAFKYLVLSAVATMLMLGGLALLVMSAGSTSFEGVREALRTAGGSPLVKIALGAFVCGLFIKGGLVPFHGWLPDAYSAASGAASVLLAGIATKVSGIYALIRVVTDVFPKDPVLSHALMLVGAVSIAVGAFAALTQQDLKRLLAYSSISQVGYIILGLGCGTPLAVAGAIFHLFNHAIFKSLLFVNSAALEDQLGTTDMGRMGGLGARMPVTGATNVVAALSTAGVPPLAGFWSKLIIIVALWQAHLQGYAILAALFSVVTLAYLLTMQRRVFFGKVAPEVAEVREAAFGLVFPAVVLAAITIVVGVLFPLILNTFLAPIRGILQG
jgi:proton-translocating NADH-quinone oxidoreductase chain N